MKRQVSPFVFCLLAGGGLVWAGEPQAAIRVRLVSPDRQCKRLLELFEGARAPHPAAALAAWKRATGDIKGLGKTVEALIALANPDMVREWRTFEGAELVLAFDPTDGQPRWRATVPHDDGTLAALATALALSGGGSDPPLGDVAVDRLGPVGSPLMARAGGRLVAAGTRADLQAALAGPQADPDDWPTIESGCLVRIDPEAFGAAGPLSRRRLAEALRALECRRLDSVASLDGETFRVVITGHFSDPPLSRANFSIDPAWLDWVPASGTLAAFAIALDPRPEAWDKAFAVADRIERADPALTDVAPVRTRLNVFALATGLKPEADLWPLLRGISGCVTTSPAGEVDGAMLALHAADQASAARIATRVVPRLTASLRVSKPGDPPAGDPDGIQLLGHASGRPLTLALRAATVLIAWGDLLPACLEAGTHPGHSAGPSIRAGWGDPAPERAGALWPARLPGVTTLSPALASALSESPPLLWHGRRGGSTSRDEIYWTGLRALVRRFLERIPLGGH